MGMHESWVGFGLGLVRLQQRLACTKPVLREGLVRPPYQMVCMKTESVVVPGLGYSTCWFA